MVGGEERWITLDDRDRVVMCNAAAEWILGRSQDTILGNKLLATLAVEPAISLNRNLFTR